ncbi:MAG: R.Pab1 family restriction endonuclease [Clostridiales Family XIII bacterium]|jgi:hypothetical protein|nr:R.Pab1 family restriction endonuclease [Clostridiales Family XIII bacterium]
MPEISINKNDKKIEMPILLTAVSGKIRVKNRSTANEYGTTVAVRRDGFKQNNYIEWQIDYDVVKKDVEKLKNSSLPKTSFISANGKEKALYELSEYIWYFYKWNIITDNKLDEIKSYLYATKNEDLIDNNSELRIERSHSMNKTINKFNFEYSQVKYPLLIHKFGKYEIITEIKITEKQFAIGTQPMLYLCFPITGLRAKSNLIGRVAEMKEIAYFDITKENIFVFVEILNIFGILSESHKHDILQIIETIQKTTDEL